MKIFIVMLSVVLMGCSLAPVRAAPEFTLAQDMYVVADITKSTSDYMCNVAPNSSTVLISSDGGSIKHARLSGLCAKRKGIKFVVVKAHSAAPFMTMYSDSVCMLEGTNIGVHSPYLPNKKIDIETLRQVLASMAYSLYTEAGYSEENVAYLTGAMFLTPSSVLSTIPNSTFESLLGYRYKGNCMEAAGL